MPAQATRVTASLFRRPLKRDEMLPEFKAVRRDPAAAPRKPFVRRLLAAAERAVERFPSIPDTTYTLWHEYGRTGVRRNYDRVQHAKRTALGCAAVLALFRREPRWIDRVHDYTWSICEETNWVPPEHMGSYPIDLFSAETGFQLAEMAHLLGGLLDQELVDRIRDEVERRILAPYLRKVYGWFDGHNNWTGVCESSVGAAFLYLEKDPVRLARAINRVLSGLDRFRRRAFLADGGSSEGVGYWQYGLINTVAFSEQLRLRTRGRVDVLGHEKFKQIARYPGAALVAPGVYYHCSDCHGRASFAPGFIARLAERTGVDELKAFLNRRSISIGPNRFAHMIRTILWWDGRTHRLPTITDRLLPDTAVARLVCPRHKLVLMAKAGHNAENHNHNDVGSFALYVAGEPVLCDPGCGLYDGRYFGPHRYENPVCGSSGHSVPVIAGRQQEFGADHCGTIEAFDAAGPVKRLELEFAKAYGLRSLRRLDRSILLHARGRDAGRLVLEDAFTFAGKAGRIQEAFVTWGRVSARGGRATVRAATGTLVLRVIEPARAAFRVEEIPVMLAGETEPTTLRRLACSLPKGAGRFRMEIVPATP